MENRAYSVEGYPDPRTPALGDLAPTGVEEHLDIPPDDIRSHRVGEDRLQCGPMLCREIHGINL